MSTPNDQGGHYYVQMYNPFESLNQVEELWKAMLQKSQHSFFTSWGWISTWIKSLPADSGVRLIVGSWKDIPILAFFVGERQYFKYGILPSRIFSLNSTGNPYYDCLYIEYNSMLSDAVIELLPWEFLHYVKNMVWDEFILPGMSQAFLSGSGTILDELSGKFHVLLDAVRNSYYVDLEKIRAGGMDFMRLLSANKRSQIRRSIKQYELDGPVETEEAQSQNEALAMFDEMVVMHQREWNRRGEPGVFSNQYMLQFHENLIRSRFAEHEIQVLKIRNSSKTIGILYCFVYHGDVLFYQSGFNYESENVYRPGLVSHYYAVLHNAAKGMKTYDFLAGEAEYKKSLSTDTNSMYWVRWIKSQPRFYIEKNILTIKNRIKTVPGLANKLMKVRYRMRSFRR